MKIKLLRKLRKKARKNIRALYFPWQRRYILQIRNIYGEKRRDWYVYEWETTEDIFTMCLRYQHFYMKKELEKWVDRQHKPQKIWPLNS